MRIHLAGCESDQGILASYAGCKNLLFSYYHVQKNPQKLFNFWNMQKTESVICDSGLFTMMFGAGKGKSYSADDLNSYARSYIAKAKTYAVNNLTIVECDVHKILGMRQVFELRKQFEDSGLSVLYVWHKEEGIDGLYRMSERYKFIALSVPEFRGLFKGSKHRYQTAVFDLLSKIKSNVKTLPRIHLLGNTVRETMETQLAWSCDSTSWKSIARYGDGQIFTRGQFVKSSMHSEAWKNEMLSNRNKDELFIREVFTEKTSVETYLNFICSARQYLKYQAWLDTHFQWAGDDSKLKGRL